jgi:glycosyltransferase involved in cell wall biosynthesis
MTAARIHLVTAVRDEEDNLPRLADALLSQSVAPSGWTIVDTGSSDGTVAIAEAAASRHPWIGVIRAPSPRRARGAPIVRAIELAADACANHPPDLFVNIDADVSFAPDFLERLAEAFDADPTLGIAGGTCYEASRGDWHERFVTGSSVWGATRAYRWACLADVRPLEPRMGWDGIDELRAQARGWSTATLRGLPFRHHRPEGALDPAWRRYVGEGATAHFMGYRPFYLLLRALHHARRHPAAVAMAAGFVIRALARRPRLDDLLARAYLRDQQRLGRLRTRARESRGATSLSLREPTTPRHPDRSAGTRGS